APPVAEVLQHVFRLGWHRMLARGIDARIDGIEDAANQDRPPDDIGAEFRRQRLDIVEGKVGPGARAVEEEFNGWVGQWDSPSSERAAIDGDGLAGDVAGFGGTQEAHDRRHLLWFGDAPGRRACGRRPFIIADFLKALIGHVGPDPTWADRVHRDAPWRDG